MILGLFCGWGLAVVVSVIGLVRRVGDTCGGGYSRTVVELLERNWSGGGSFGTIEVVELGVVAGDVALVASTVVALVRVAKPCVGEERGRGRGRILRMLFGLFCCGCCAGTWITVVVGNIPVVFAVVERVRDFSASGAGSGGKGRDGDGDGRTGCFPCRELDMRHARADAGTGRDVALGGSCCGADELTEARSDGFDGGDTRFSSRKYAFQRSRYLRLYFSSVSMAWCLS